MNSPIPSSLDASPRPFVVLGDDWGRHVSTTQHIFRRIARRHPVVWLNAINHRTPKLSPYDARRAAQKIGEMLRWRRREGERSVPPSNGSDLPDSRPEAIVPPRILPWHNNRVIRHFNTRSLLHDLRGALARLGDHRPPVLITATPAIPDVVRQLDAVAKFYFCIDDYAELQGVDKDLVRPLEVETLSAVDAVIATAKSLVASKRAASGRGFYLPQGVNYEHFAEPQSTPPDMEAIPRPRIGFAGNLAPVCDLELLRSIAQSRPDWSVVLVGPISVDPSSLRLPNVHILGPKPYASLPSYVQAFDVGIIPYLLNAWSRAVDPLKTLEYLAAGIPVVSLPLPEMHKYAPPVRVAADYAEFRDALAEALAEQPNAAAARQALAQEHTWERRAEQLMDIVERVREECAWRQRGYGNANSA
jgi:glycosyltransferase involved in cell wall biosynthesis